MCEICKKHGDGDTWYFNPKNYSRDMGEAKSDFLEKIAGKHFNEWLINGMETIEQFQNIPILNKIVVNLSEKYLDVYHGGQIIPLPELLQVLELIENPALLPCVCREMVGKEKYCCLNFGLLPDLYKKANPNDYIEEVSVQKAKRLLTEWNKVGYYHLILYSKAPYITTVCNCTGHYCTAYKDRNVLGTKTTLLKSEFVAKVKPNLCNGCRTCLSRCQFGAILFDLDENISFVNVSKCFGCGLCQTGCKLNAIEMIERRLSPAKNLW
jgi:ferredoxin